MRAGDPASASASVAAPDRPAGRRDSVNPCSTPSGPAVYHSDTPAPRAYVTRSACACGATAASGCRRPARPTASPPNDKRPPPPSTLTPSRPSVATVPPPVSPNPPARGRGANRGSPAATVEEITDCPWTDNRDSDANPPGRAPAAVASAGAACRRPDAGQPAASTTADSTAAARMSGARRRHHWASPRPHARADCAVSLHIYPWRDRRSRPSCRATGASRSLAVVRLGLVLGLGLRLSVAVAEVGVNALMEGSATVSAGSMCA